MSKSLVVLVVAQTPPPLHGQAVMSQYFLEGRYEGIELHHIRMAFSDDIQEVGKVGVRKVFHLLNLIFQIVSAKIRLGPEALYYPPASPNLSPFLRDCCLLIATRWMFPITIFHFHATGISELQNRFPRVLKWLYRLAYLSPDLSICLSTLAGDDAQDFHSKRIVIVPNGIPDQPEAAQIQRLEQKLSTILFLGTVSEEKGVSVLLEALAILAEKTIAFRCIIGGGFASPMQERELRLKSSALNLDTIVEWRGPVTGERKWNCYRDADIFCFPTHYRTEGFPVVLLEAMMFGLPIVTTCWRAIPEIVLDGENGFVTPIRDARATAHGLAKLLQNSSLRDSMGNEGRLMFVEKYRIEVFRQNMETALRSLM
jgi:glycosyltransferase involved in cell wall biosynthesis